MAIYNFELDGKNNQLKLELSRVGAQGAQGVSGSTLTWLDYTTTFSSIPTLTASIAGGEVYTYLYNNDSLTLYRYITENADEFYQNFNGATLSELVSIKQQTLTL